MPLLIVAPITTSTRASWYTNTASTYAGVFLWIGFYQSIGEGTISQAHIWGCLLGLAVAVVLTYAL